MSTDWMVAFQKFHKMFTFEKVAIYKAKYVW